jgi:hypothetical protein
VRPTQSSGSRTQAQGKKRKPILPRNTPRSTDSSGSRHRAAPRVLMQAASYLPSTVSFLSYSVITAFLVFSQLGEAAHLSFLDRSWKAHSISSVMRSSRHIRRQVWFPCKAAGSREAERSLTLQHSGLQ